jgi:IclR family KDG regulon transcriptional repressor
MEKTLAKGLMVLEALIHRGQPCGVSDLATSLGISKSNAHRLLNTLVDVGYVASIDGRYAATLKIWELGTRIIGHYDVRDLARPAMTRLVHETAEGVRLTVLDPKSLEVVYIDKIDSPQDVRTFTDVGGRSPAHCTSSGKIMLAYQDDAVIKRVARKMKAYTQWTIVDPDKFVRHIEKVRADGYALNRREFSAQVSGVAAPIFDADGNVIAALSIAAPAERLPAGRLKKVTAMLCKAAARVTAKLQPASPGVLVPSGRITKLARKKSKRSDQFDVIPASGIARRNSKL